MVAGAGVLAVGINKSEFDLGQGERRRLGRYSPTIQIKKGCALVFEAVRVNGGEREGFETC